MSCAFAISRNWQCYYRRLDPIADIGESSPVSSPARTGERVWDSCPLSSPPYGAGAASIDAIPRRKDANLVPEVTRAKEMRGRSCHAVDRMPSTLDHTDWPQSGNLFCQSGSVDDFHDLVGVLR